MSTLGLLIFDMDGTLIDAMEQHANAFSKILEEYGIPYDFSKKLYLSTAGQPLDQQFKLAFKEYGTSFLPDLNNLIEAFWIFVEKTEPKVFPDVPSAVKKLYEVGYTLIVTSGCSPAVVSSKMKRSGLAKYFRLLLGTDYNVPAMTKGEGHFRIIQEELRLSPVEFSTNSALIGDGRHDMEIARRAGIIAIGRITDNNANDLREAGATFLVNTLDQLVQILRAQPSNSNNFIFMPVSALRRQQ